MARFFAATMVGGKIYVEGVSERGPWDAQRLIFQEEAVADRVLVPGTGDRKVYTSQSLEEAVRESEKRQLALRVWIHEALAEVAHLIWERQHR